MDIKQLRNQSVKESSSDNLENHINNGLYQEVFDIVALYVRYNTSVIIRYSAWFCRHIRT